MKKETLEEVAKKESKYLSDWEDKQTWIDGFIEGAKWQQEQDKNKYDEDMLLAFVAGVDKESYNGVNFYEWFEQFKKKYL